jgi:FkbM family methyltransferase
MNRQLALPSRKMNSYARQMRSCMNAFRLGIVFVRVRWFRMPEKISVAGNAVSLHYPLEKGVRTDFIGCCIRNDYGLSEQLAKVETILDIGANLGFFSIAARSHYPKAKIHAYEPNPRVLSFLDSNISPLGIGMFPEAVGAEDGHVSIIDGGASNQARTESSLDGTIPLISLDTAIERLGGTVDLLKLDCEGAEWDMFRSKNPWRHIRNIRMEYHLFQGQTVEDLEQALDSLSFKVTHWQPDVGFGIVWAVNVGQAA